MHHQVDGSIFNIVWTLSGLKRLPGHASSCIHALHPSSNRCILAARKLVWGTFAKSCHSRKEHMHLVRACAPLKLLDSVRTFVTQARKLVFTSVDRAISYYDANRGAYELSGRVYASGSMGVPQVMTLVEDETGALCVRVRVRVVCWASHRVCGFV